MILTIITFVIVLIILVVIHELGHFAAAKLLGIKVEEFGFGLPPKIWGKKFGETLYSINWLPIGGFVRLFGEDSEHPEKVTKDKSRAFFAKSPFHRSIVLLAGVTMNFLLGWIILSFLLTRGLLIPTGNVRIEEISDQGPAYTAGILVGDIVEKITTPENETLPIKSNSDLISITARNLDKEIVLFIKREGQNLSIPIMPRSNPPEGEGSMGIVISDLQVAQYSIVQAPVEGLKHTWFIVTSTVAGIGDSIAKVATNRASQVQVAGIVGIGQIVGEARKFGTESLLYVVAVLSVNLALINLMPFPALDGGRLVFVVYEGVTGKKIKPQYEAYLHQLGMIILMGLMLLITVNDILRFGR